jgi:general secretion pathway protein M
MVFMLKKLTKREKYAIYALSGAVILFILIQFVIFPSIDKRRRLKRTIQVKENLLLEMINLKSDYDAVEKRTSLAKVNFENREKDFTLFSFLDSLTGKARIKEYVTYMKPSTTVQKNNSYKISQVEMKFKGLTLEQLTTYLHMVETSKNMVRIERLSISKTGKQEGFVDAVLQVETVEK